MRHYNPEREVTHAFVGRVAGWIETAGEVLVVLRYLAAAGSKDFAFCRSRRDLEAIVAWAAVGTDVVVLRDARLPLRGVVTEAFIAAAQREVPPGQEYLILTEEKAADAPVSAFSAFDDDREDLVLYLRRLAGRTVAFGKCPDFLAADHEGLISASKGGIDGPR